MECGTKCATAVPRNFSTSCLHGSSPNSASLESLNADALHHVLSYLNLWDLVRLSRSCSCLERASAVARYEGRRFVRTFNRTDGREGAPDSRGLCGPSAVAVASFFFEGRRLFSPQATSYFLST